MSKPPPLWHSEAKALRGSGVDPQVIADRLDKSITMVRWVLDENGERDATRERVRLAREFERQAARRSTDKPQRFHAEPRTARAAAKAVARETIDQAVRDFSEHKIDRATLMARITPRKWA